MYVLVRCGASRGLGVGQRLAGLDYDYAASYRPALSHVHVQTAHLSLAVVTTCSEPAVWRGLGQMASCLSAIPATLVIDCVVT